MQELSPLQFYCLAHTQVSSSAFRIDLTPCLARWLRSLQATGNDVTSSLNQGQHTRRLCLQDLSHASQCPKQADTWSQDVLLALLSCGV